MHLPKDGCKDCPSHLICLTAGDSDDIMHERFLRQCMVCKKKIMFYTGDDDFREGGHVLRWCPLGTEEGSGFRCRECRKGIAIDALNYALGEMEDTG